MGLSDGLARLAARHAHALVVEVPGHWRLRAAGERAVLARGWRLALSPADADLLVVCGEPGPSLADAVELVWHQLPGPRVRVDLTEADDVVARLDAGAAGLLDGTRHRQDAEHRSDGHDLLASQTGEDSDHGAMDHGGMDHGGMDMAPAGIPLAGGGEDRDELEMDLLEVPLGPVLPHWPAGLVLHCTLQGDVLVRARAEVLDATPSPVPHDEVPARRVDTITSLLALAGWDAAATRARRTRDDALEPDADTRAALEQLRRRVRRSRVLRWSLRGLGHLSEADVVEHGLPAGAAGDTWDRLCGLLDAAVEEERTRQSGRAAVADRSVPADRVADLVTGLDLAAARVVLASLDLQQLVPADGHREVSRG